MNKINQDDNMKTLMGIELKPIEELKQKVEIPVNFSEFIQKALKYDIKSIKRKLK